MRIRPGLRGASRFAAGRRAAGVLLVAVAAGLAVRIVLQRQYTPLASDSVHYVLLARALAAGQGFVSGGSQHPDLSRSPMLPLLTAGVARTSGLDALTAGRVTVAVASALLVVPLFFLTRRLFGPLAALASLPLGAFSCALGTAIHVMPAAPYLLFAVGALAAAASAARRPRATALLAAGVLAGAAAITRPEGLIVAIAIAAWAGIDLLTRRRSRSNRGMGAALAPVPAPAVRTRSRRLRVSAASALLVAAGAAAVYGPYTAWASWRLGRFSPVPGMQYLSDMRLVCDRLSLREMDGPDLPWAERALFVVSADRTRRVLETWFDTRVLLPPAATFAGATGSPEGPAPIPQTPSLAGIALRRLRIVGESVRSLPSALREGHFLPVVPVLLGGAGLLAALTRRRRRRAVVFLALMGAAMLAPIVSHVEARFLYAPFVLGLVVAACGWGWIGARLLAVGRGGATGRALCAGASLALGAGVAVSGVGHTDGSLEPRAREALHRGIAGEVARAAGSGPVLSVQANVPFWAGRPYRPIPVGPPGVVLDYARAQGAACLVLEGSRDLSRRPELAPLAHDPPPAGFRLVSARPALQGGELRVFRIEGGAGD